MNEDITNIAVVGLGYVGLPLACAFSKHYNIIGFDVSKEKIALLKEGIDPTKEANLNACNVTFTDDEKDIGNADVIIVAVPTPIDENNKPDMKYLESASEIVGRNMKEGSIVVYESTVYPGATEEVCLPILEKESGLRLNKGFYLGYSPERINPGDKKHTVDKIIKVVSASDEKVAKKLSEVYGKITKVHIAPSIMVAEAAKVIENIQRDLNIALMNELSIIFEKLGIRTKDVLDAAGTKWNFHKYTPGLVGGHCIGVDPYYLTYKAEELGYDPKVILAGRKLNDSMHEQVVHLTEKAIGDINGRKILVMGLTFKENVPDYRNSRAVQLIKSLKKKGASVYGYDPLLDDDIIKNNFDADIGDINENYDLIIVHSYHDIFKDIDLSKITNRLIDIKSRIGSFKGDYYAL